MCRTIRLLCKIMSIIYHQSQKHEWEKMATISEYCIEVLVNIHNDLIDQKRKKYKEKGGKNWHKYRYVTNWQYTWDLDEEGRLHGKIYIDTPMDDEEQ